MIAKIKILNQQIILLQNDITTLKKITEQINKDIQQDKKNGVINDEKKTDANTIKKAPETNTAHSVDMYNNNLIKLPNIYGLENNEKKDDCVIM
jgi:hypothetical protein